MTRRLRYSEEFQKAAVERVLSGVTPQAVAEELGVKESMVVQWMKKWASKPELKQREERVAAELARLRRENARLKQANEILKKASSDFDKSM